ncbi:unnamed protein product [Symbiodinium pilosum]|uniref:Uncharacterized protein n=1 Tax=Symbiodinium pilosum TaxID=2952 RepID=A0A812V2K7_SYMPI|nr:unnamed protein product [Symbiodinium pilosum]
MARIQELQTELGADGGVASPASLPGTPGPTEFYLPKSAGTFAPGLLARPLAARQLSQDTMKLGTQNSFESETQAAHVTTPETRAGCPLTTPGREQVQTAECATEETRQTAQLPPQTTPGSAETTARTGKLSPQTALGSAETTPGTGKLSPQTAPGSAETTPGTGNLSPQTAPGSAETTPGTGPSTSVETTAQATLESAMGGLRIDSNGRADSNVWEHDRQPDADQLSTYGSHKEDAVARMPSEISPDQSPNSQALLTKKIRRHFQPNSKGQIKEEKEEEELMGGWHTQVSLEMENWEMIKNSKRWAQARNLLRKNKDPTGEALLSSDINAEDVMRGADADARAVQMTTSSAGASGPGKNQLQLPVLQENADVNSLLPIYVDVVGKKLDKCAEAKDCVHERLDNLGVERAARLAQEMDAQIEKYQKIYDSLLDAQTSIMENPSRSYKEQLMRLFIACTKADVAINNLMTMKAPTSKKEKDPTPEKKGEQDSEDELANELLYDYMHGGESAYRTTKIANMICRAGKHRDLAGMCSVQAWTLSELFPLLIMVMKGEDCVNGAHVHMACIAGKGAYLLATGYQCIDKCHLCEATDKQQLVAYQSGRQGFRHRRGLPEDDDKAV